MDHAANGTNDSPHNEPTSDFWDDRITFDPNYDDWFYGVASPAQR
jgi:hypothetical protein